MEFGLQIFLDFIPIKDDLCPESHFKQWFARHWSIVEGWLLNFADSSPLQRDVCPESHQALISCHLNSMELRLLDFADFGLPRVDLCDECHIKQWFPAIVLWRLGYLFLLILVHLELTSVRNYIKQWFPAIEVLWNLGYKFSLILVHFRCIWVFSISISLPLKCYGVWTTSFSWFEST